MKNERKEELKDEMKNRISLALKDPILQQGFEIICKENAELKKNLSDAETAFDKMFWQKNELIQNEKDNLTKAKEIILTLLPFEENLDSYMYECDNAQNGELLKPFTNARELLKDCLCKKCKGEGIVRVDYNGWDKNPCPTCKGTGYIF